MVARKKKTTNSQLLTALRNRARRVIMSHGSVTADDLQHYAKAKHDWKVPTALWGCVFRDASFRKIGFRQSTNPANHGRYVAVWGRA